MELTGKCKEEFKEWFEDKLTLTDVSQQRELLNRYEIWKRFVNIRTEYYTSSTLIKMYLKTI